MKGNAKTGQSVAGRSQEDSAAGGVSVLPTVAHDSDVAQRARQERARWHLTLGAIRAHLDEQPSRRARLTAARRWCAAIAQMAEEAPR